MIILLLASGYAALRAHGGAPSFEDRNSKEVSNSQDRGLNRRMNRGVATAWELVWLRNKEDNMDDLGRNSKIEVQGGNARVRRKFRMRSYFKKRVASLSNRLVGIRGTIHA